MREVELAEFMDTLITAEVEGLPTVRGRVEFIGPVLTEPGAPLLVGMADVQTGERFAVHAAAIVSAGTAA